MLLPKQHGEHLQQQQQQQLQKKVTHAICGDTDTDTGIGLTMVTGSWKLVGYVPFYLPQRWLHHEATWKEDVLHLGIELLDDTRRD